MRELGHDLDDIAAQEVDPGLGNGGLGRLAACFLDSLATLHYPAVGYGIRYDYGIFTQVIGADGGQREVASSWLRLRNVWETPRGNVRFTVRFGGRVEAARERGAAEIDAHRWVDTSDIYAIGFDQLIPGNRGPTVNHLRLWSGRAITPFHIDAFNAGDYAAAVQEQVEAKNLSRVLYPDDSTPQGKELRLKQQYFFVSASLQDILATHLSEGRSLASHARLDRHSVERHASGGGDSGADAAADRRARPVVVRKLADHHRGVFVHQSHPAAGGARDLAGGDVRAAAAAASADHLSDQSRFPAIGRGALPRRRRTAGGGCPSSTMAAIAACAWRISPSSAATGSTASLSCIRISCASRCFPDLPSCIRIGSSM